MVARVSTRIEPIRKDIDVFVADLRGPAAAEQFRDFALAELEDAKATNQSVLGRVPPFLTIVDGHRGAPIRSANIRSTIVVEFELITEALIWISEQLQKFSPVKSGRYKRNHILLADGQEVAIGTQVKLAQEYVFINTVPYARKIERGASSEAPNGVYEAVALLARARFGRMARITFSFRTVIGGRIIGGRPGDRAPERNPAIVVRLAGA